MALTDEQLRRDIEAECEREGHEYANDLSQEDGEPAVCIHCGEEMPC